MTTNVYLVMEDGESRCFAAPSMAAAIEAAWHQCLLDEAEPGAEPPTEQEALAERRDWEDNVLQSVTLVGELENLDDLVRLRPEWITVAEAFEAAAKVAELTPVHLDPAPEPTNEVLALMTNLRAGIAAAIRARKGERTP